MWTLSDVRCMYQQETALKRAKAIAVACRTNSLSSLPPHVRELSAAPQPCLGLGTDKAPRTLVLHKPTFDIDCGKWGKPRWHGAQIHRIGVRLIPANHKVVLKERGQGN